MRQRVRRGEILFVEVRRVFFTQSFAMAGRLTASPENTSNIERINDVDLLVWLLRSRGCWWPALAISMSSISLTTMAFSSFPFFFWAHDSAIDGGFRIPPHSVSS